MIHNKGYKVKFLAAVTFIIVLSVNFLANYLPINGVMTSEISDKYESLFTPPGFIFAIWGVIYILLFLFTVYQFLELRNKETEIDDNYVEKVSGYFMFSNIFNVLWILAWHYDLILLSTIFMFFVYIYLFLIMLQIHKTYNSLKDRIFIEIPFSIYFGWINVALLANLMAVYKYFSLEKLLNENLTTIIVILLGIIIIASTSIYFKSISYLLTGAISYVSIFLNHVNPNKYNSNYKYIIASLIGSFVVFIAVYIYVFYKKYIKKRSTIFSN